MKAGSLKIFIEESNINCHNWFTTGEGFSNPIFKKYVGGLGDRWAMRIDNDVGQWAPDFKLWNKLGEQFIQRFKAGQVPLDSLVKTHYRLGNKIFKLCQEVDQRGIGRASTLQLTRWLKRMWRLYLDLNGVGFVLVISDFEHGLFTKMLTEILDRKKLSAELKQQSLSLLTSPTQKTLYWQEQLELLGLCRRFRSIAQLKASPLFKRHVQKYFWLNYGYQGPPWTERDFIERAAIFYKKGKLNEQCRAHRDSFVKLKRQQAELAKRIRLTARERSLFNTAAAYTYLKGYRIEVRHRYSQILDSIFAELGRRLHLPLTFFQYALKPEILNAIGGRKVPVRQIVSRRKKMLCLYERGRATIVKPNQIDREWNRLIFKESFVSADALTGQSAYLGQARGKVKIMKSAADVDKVNHGDILVTVSTNPDFLPAMMRASAYVTDQGGITSHAAIVAREMKKPCIIGTKVATKVFKNGDKVEVDATKGIVKKL